MNRVQIIVSSVLCCALMAAPWVRAADQDALAVPASSDKRANYNFRDLAIAEAFDMLSQEGKVNIIVTRV